MMGAVAGLPMLALELGWGTTLALKTQVSTSGKRWKMSFWLLPIANQGDSLAR